MYNLDAFCRAGCTTPRGARLWEERGLLGAVARTSNDVRCYSDEQMQLAKIIAAAQFGNFSLEQIGEMVKDYDDEVRDAILIRLGDQIRAAEKLANDLSEIKFNVKYDL